MGPSSFGLYCTLEIIYSLLAVGLLCQSLANISEIRGGDSYWYLALIPLLVLWALLAQGLAESNPIMLWGWMLVVLFTSKLRQRPAP